MKPFYWLSATILKIYFKIFHRIKIYGREHAHRSEAIIAPNHTSYLDPPILGASWPYELHYLAKESLFHVPILSFLIRRLNTHPVTGNVADITSLKLIGNLIQEHHQVAIFPEGERSFNGELGPLKTGISMLALRYQCPIIPVYIHGPFKIWNRFRRFPKLYGKIICIFGTPITLEEFRSLHKKEAQQALTNKLAESIENLRHWYEEGAHGSPP